MATKRITEEECWFVIGAHQAGATERQCSDLSGLSKTITHNIITNFKKLGSPHASKLSLNALLTTTNSTNTNNKRKSDQLSKNEAMKPRKRGRPRNPTEAPFFTQAIVRNALLEGKIDQKKQQQHYSPQIYPLDRLNTPPSSDEDIHIKRQRRDSSILTDELPPTPRSILALDESSDDENNNHAMDMEKKKSATEEKNWSIEDDEQLLSHVLGLPMNNFKWKGLESQFGDRHMAKMCAERWDFLKKQLLKDAHLIMKEESS